MANDATSIQNFCSNYYNHIQIFRPCDQPSFCTNHKNPSFQKLNNPSVHKQMNVKTKCHPSIQRNNILCHKKKRHNHKWKCTHHKAYSPSTKRNSLMQLLYLSSSLGSQNYVYVSKLVCV